jgi:phosphate transport system substrate-binding protein
VACCRSFLLAGVALMVAACSNGSPQTAAREKFTVNIAGSTSVMPFSEKLAEHFMLDHPTFAVNVQAGGSTAGVQACITHTVDIGMCSRDLKAEERVLTAIPICYDGIAIVVNPLNPVTSLSLAQVRSIFNGSVKNWSQLGWIDRRIDAVSREEGSGTRGAFEELVMGTDTIDDATMVQDSNGSVREVVATDPYAIGYLSLGIVDERVVAVAIDNVKPSVETIKNKSYKIVRPFLYLTMGTPSEAAQLFIRYVLSEAGQSLLIKEGLIPANDFSSL